MNPLPVARRVRGAAPGDRAWGRVALTHEDRLIRRKRLATEAGAAFLVDLPELRDVREGEVFDLGDGRVVAIAASVEALMEVRGEGLARLAWHVGNRHAPCQIEPDRLLLRRDPVLRAMLVTLGARVVDVAAPFAPEGGAYGHGRTMGHDHGDGHGHDQGHGHAYGV